MEIENFTSTSDSFKHKIRLTGQQEKRKQMKRRPDGVAWHAANKWLYFLEFSRLMDHDDTMVSATERKGAQYDAAVEAVEQHNRNANQVVRVQTLPLLFGV